MCAFVGVHVIGHFARVLLTGERKGVGKLQTYSILFAFYARNYGNFLVATRPAKNSI